MKSISTNHCVQFVSALSVTACSLRRWAVTVNKCVRVLIFKTDLHIENSISRSQIDTNTAEVLSGTFAYSWQLDFLASSPKKMWGIFQFLLCLLSLGNRMCRKMWRKIACCCATVGYKCKSPPTLTEIQS